MPRLKNDIIRDHRLSVFVAWATRDGLKRTEDIARRLDCSNNTVLNIKKKPETLTIERIARMKLSKDELFMLVYGGERE